MSPYYQGNIITAINAVLPGGIANILNLGLGIGAILALGVIIYGGILYSTSGYNPSNKKEAQTWIIAAVKGLALIALGFILLQILNPSVLNISEVNIERLQRISPPTIQESIARLFAMPPMPEEYNEIFFNTVITHTQTIDALEETAGERDLTEAEKREISIADTERAKACDSLCDNAIISGTKLPLKTIESCWPTEGEKLLPRRMGCID